MDVLSRKFSILKVRANAVRLCAVFACVLLAPTMASGQEETLDESDSEQQPYIVFVAEDSAHARCGPGKQHYRTDALRVGQELEVYVETDDGWLGIRPVESSFCWMPAEAVDLSDDGQSGTIREDQTVAWIGTNLGQAKNYRYQVELDAGESVAVLELGDHEGDGGTRRWLRIAPPSGEFRWVHRSETAESAEQLATLVANRKARNQRGDKAVVAQVAMDQEQQSESDDTPTVAAIRSDDPSSSESSRRVVKSDALTETDAIPELRPVPSETDEASESMERPRVADRAFQVHRGADPEDFVDRGAVIGSGLREQWKDDEEPEIDLTEYVDDGSQSVLQRLEIEEEEPKNGAAAAAEAITAPIRRMTDAVANFISPPRIVEIDSANYNFLAERTAADRRWQVGSGSYGPGLPNPAAYGDFRATGPPPGALIQRPLPPSSLAGQVQSALGLPIPVSPVAVSGISASGVPVMQTGAAFPTPAPTPSRVVSIAQISRVEDAVANANIETVAQILSQLMSEAASADEVDPLIRRTENLLRSGDVNAATRTRDILDRAQRYRNVAARRDGVTTIRSTSLANVKPLPGTVAATASVDIGSPMQVQTSGSASVPVGNELGGTAGQSVTTTPLGPVTGAATGYLVQVYSSRPNSPPFALTDDAGLTIAYVTPYPGVNLRNHLNSRIHVSGNEKLLEGMSTPHILVNRAIRR